MPVVRGMGDAAVTQLVDDDKLECRAVEAMPSRIHGDYLRVTFATNHPTDYSTDVTYICRHETAWKSAPPFAVGRTYRLTITEVEA